MRADLLSLHRRLDIIDRPMPSQVILAHVRYSDKCGIQFRQRPPCAEDGLQLLQDVAGRVRQQIIAQPVQEFAAVQVQHLHIFFALRLALTVRLLRLFSVLLSSRCAWRRLCDCVRLFFSAALLAAF